MSIPEQPFGFVAGRWVLSIADTPMDSDRAPDYKPLTPGSVIFVNKLSHRVINDGTGGTVGIVKTRYEGRLNENGELVDEEAQPYIALPVGVYSVTFSFGQYSWPNFDIEVTAAHTVSSPLWLPTESPLPSGPGVVQVVTDESRLAAEAAAIRAEAAADAAEEAITLPDGTDPGDVLVWIEEWDDELEEYLPGSWSVPPYYTALPSVRTDFGFEEGRKYSLYAEPDPGGHGNIYWDEDNDNKLITRNILNGLGAGMALDPDSKTSHTRVFWDLTWQQTNTTHTLKLADISSSYSFRGLLIIDVGNAINATLSFEDATVLGQSITPTSVSVDGPGRFFFDIIGYKRSWFISQIMPGGGI